MSLKRNTIWNLVGAGLPLLAAAACIPYCLNQLGKEAFGVLTLIWALIGYFSLFDFGTGRALTYELSKLRHDNQREKIQVTLKAGLILTLFSGALGTLIVLALAFQLAHNWLNISLQWQADTYLAFLIAAAGIIPTTLASGQRGAMEGLDRFDASNINKIFLGFCMFILPALSIWLHGASLSHIAFYLVASRFLVVIIGVIQLRDYLLTPLNSPLSTDTLLTHMRSLISYGLWLTLSGIIGPMMVYGDRFFVSAAVGADQLSLYSIPQEGLIRLLIVPVAICGALLPTFTTITDQKQLISVYQKNHRRLTLIMLALCIASALFAYPILSVWLSPEFAKQAIPVVLIFALGIWINSIAVMPFILLQSKGKTALTAQFHVIELFVYILLLYILANRYGLIGAAWAWVIRVSLDLLLLHFAAARMLKLKEIESPSAVN
jgi:O-antigen/teichoic acid export membrane protein